MNLSEALRLYDETFLSMKEIEQITGVPPYKLSGLLFNRGNAKDNPRVKKALEMYKTGQHSLTELESLVGLSRQTLAKHFKALDQEIHNPLRKHAYQENYFKAIDSEEKAYWLGFIYADGSINEHPTHLRLEIGLKEEDRGHLIKFVKAIGGQDDLVKRKVVRLKGKEYVSYKVTISCTEMCRDLIQHGVTPRKSLTLTFPNHLTPDLIRHFIRGYFDGDGCINVKKNGKFAKIARFNVVGTEAFLQALQDHFEQRLGASRVRLYKKRNNKAWSYEKGGLEALTILEYLYKGASIYLDRKYKQAIAVLEGNF